MKKQVNLKDQIWEQLCSLGAVLASILALILLLYFATVIIRIIASLAL